MSQTTKNGRSYLEAYTTNHIVASRGTPPPYRYFQCETMVASALASYTCNILASLYYPIS